MCGFIDFERIEDAASARSALHEAKFADCELRVEYKVRSFSCLALKYRILHFIMFDTSPLITTCFVNFAFKQLGAAGKYPPGKLVVPGNIPSSSSHARL